MKIANAIWILVIACLLSLCAWIVIGPWVPHHPLALFAVIVLFGAPNFGAIWMMYTAARYELNAITFVALAFIPFTFLWYYFERYRTGKCFTRVSGQGQAHKGSRS